MKYPVWVSIYCVITNIALAQTSPAKAQLPKSSASKVMRAQVSPVLTLTASTASASVGTIVRFTAAWDREMPQMAYHFDFGDGQSADTQQPVASHAYSNAGMFTIRASGRALLRSAGMVPRSFASNAVAVQVSLAANRGLSTYGRKVKVPPQNSGSGSSPPPMAPQLTLRADSISPQLNQAVRFVGTWNQNVYRVQYSFDWGDGQTTGSAEPVATHSYSQPGAYTVRLVATSLSPALSARVPAVRSNEVVITVAQPAPPTTPRLALSADNLNPLAGDTVHFTGRWLARKSPPSSYRFEWGDGQINQTSSLIAQHSYRASGSFRAHVTAIPLGETSSEVVSNEVLLSVTRPPAPPPPAPTPTLTLNADQFAPLPNQRVHFTTTWDYSVFGARYQFAWGDGQISDSDSADAYHSYSSPGNYTVRVVARGLANDRNFSSRSNVVTIAVATPPPPPAPIPSLTLNADQSAPLPNQRVHFTTAWDHAVSGARYQFAWGDGQISDSDSADAYHSYSSPGNYTVRVFARALANARTVSSRSNLVTIAVASPPPPPKPHEKATASLTADHYSAQIGEVIHFKASVSLPSGSAQYHFVFGDGNAQDSLTNEVTYSYSRQGDFHPWVTASITSNDTPVTSPPIALAVVNTKSEDLVRPHIGVALKTEKLVAGRDVVLQASLNPAHDDATYEFEWGDGTPPVRVDSHGVASHRYAQKGRYSVLVTASTGEAYPAPIQQSLILVISRSLWPFTLFEWLIIAAGVGLGAKAVRFFRNRWNRAPAPRPQFHVRGSIDLGSHAVIVSDKSVPHLSITLKPGMDSAEHEMIVTRHAAASD